MGSIICGISVLVGQDECVYECGQMSLSPFCVCFPFDMSVLIKCAILQVSGSICFRTSYGFDFD